MHYTTAGSAVCAWVVVGEGLCIIRQLVLQFVRGWWWVRDCALNNSWFYIELWLSACTHKVDAPLWPLR